VAKRLDYDADPARYRLGMQVSRSFPQPGTISLYERIWQLLPDRPQAPIVDVGCADGALSAARRVGRAARLIGLDYSAVMLRAHPQPAVRADATALPLRDRSASAVIAVNMLYHLDDPGLAMREARRTVRLRPACSATSSRAGGQRAWCTLTRT
jgi:SAM-dependent methyltransferase